ncbi:MAG: hypothetical protein AB7V48_01790 [Sedimentibacter sp.]
MSKIIGMSRNIKLEWLNKVADLYITGKIEAEIKDDLNEYLSFEIESPTNLRKSREILMNIWVENIEGTEMAKDLAIKLFKSNKNENKLLAHWCMIILTYPVFSDICSTIGKMDRQMFDISTREIKNKMFDLWGERSTLYHSIDKNIKTLKDINVLAPLTNNKYGVNKYKIDCEEGLVLITYALICTKEKLYVSIDELNNSPLFFPFDYNISVVVLENSNIFKIDKFGGELVVSR